MSRPISSLEERRCAEANLELLILPIARDEVAFVVPRANDWLHSVSLEKSAQFGGQTLSSGGVIYDRPTLTPRSIALHPA